jgi:hypothetical protein
MYSNKITEIGIKLYGTKIIFGIHSKVINIIIYFSDKALSNNFFIIKILKI